MRNAIGLIAGPLRPAVTFEIRGLRVSASIAIATKVLTKEIASAPALAAARAIRPIEVTFGESLTITGRFAADFTVETMSSSIAGSQPKIMPPCFVFGQDTLIS